MSEQAPHMVKQVIHFSDGSEKVINYRGVIVDGVLTPDVIEEGIVKDTPAPVEEAVEAPVEEAPVSEEAPAEQAPAPEEASINS